MDSKDIEKIQRLSAAIDNFKDCYKCSELWGVQDGPVSADTLITFLIENPHFQQIADEIKRLNK